MMKNKYTNHYGNKKLSKDTNPNRKVIDKVKKLRIDIAKIVIRDEFGDIETARKFWNQSQERIIDIQKKLYEGKKLQKSDFQWMNTIHKMVKKRVTS